MSRQFEHVGFETAIEGREEEFPTLARALKDTRKAYSTKIEWLVESLDGKKEVWFNYTQIQRNPYLSDREAALTAHLRGVEQTLTHGIRTLGLYATLPLSTCGGAFEILGRELGPHDHLSFRPLLDLQHRSGGEQEPEFWSEFSLQVNPDSALVEA